MAMDAHRQFETRTQQAAQLGRELEITKDRLASKEVQLSESKRVAQEGADSPIIMAGQSRKPGSAPGNASSNVDRDHELLKLYQEREERLAQLERLRGQNLALNRNLINANCRAEELQAKIQNTVKREAASHARVLELTDSLRKAGLPTPLGAQPSPDELRQFESDREIFLGGGAKANSKANGESPDSKGRSYIEQALTAEVEGLQQEASFALAQNEMTIQQLHEALDSVSSASAELEERLAKVTAERDEARDELAAMVEGKAAGNHVLDAWKVRRCLPT